MKTQSTLSKIFGPLFGTGPGAGMGLLISICGAGAVLTAIIGYALPVIRNVEDSVPDHAVLGEAVETAS
jgi:MFS transporter, DHA3 family, macrolide efflux protein